MRSFVAVAALVVALATPFVALSERQFAAGRGGIDTRAGQAAFTFSYHGSLNGRRSYSVTIYGNGAVSSTGTVLLPVKALRLSKDTLNGLLKLARAESFFSLPQTLGGEPVTDAGSIAITVHTTSQTKTVVELEPTRNARFDQIFAVLSAVVGLPN
jgi:hypothetical protein